MGTEDNLEKHVKILMT